MPHTGAHARTYPALDSFKRKRLTNALAKDFARITEVFQRARRERYGRGNSFPFGTITTKTANANATTTAFRTVNTTLNVVDYISAHGVVVLPSPHLHRGLLVMSMVQFNLFICFVCLFACLFVCLSLSHPRALVNSVQAQPHQTQVVAFV